ncbi:hypothetical protein FQR65_LT07130 [Abscondita terminalis]|nr:hypothetical protein FQR65_LT07130 [Abscondita terminalis]
MEIYQLDDRIASEVEGCSETQSTINPTSPSLLTSKQGTDVIEFHTLPVGSILGNTSRITKHNSTLLYKDVQVKITHLSKAGTDYLTFLRSMGRQIVPLGHIIIRFDKPRLLRRMKKHSSLDGVMRLIHGFSDTLKLLGKGEAKKGQGVLARKFLGLDWQSVLDNAHNACVNWQKKICLKMPFHWQQSLSNPNSRPKRKN